MRIDWLLQVISKIIYTIERSVKFFKGFEVLDGIFTSLYDSWKIHKQLRQFIDPFSFLYRFMAVDFIQSIMVRFPIVSCGIKALVKVSTNLTSETKD